MLSANQLATLFGFSPPPRPARATMDDLLRISEKSLDRLTNIEKSIKRDNITPRLENQKENIRLQRQERNENNRQRILLQELQGLRQDLQNTLIRGGGGGGNRGTLGGRFGGLGLGALGGLAGLAGLGLGGGGGKTPTPNIPNTPKKGLEGILNSGRSVAGKVGIAGILLGLTESLGNITDRLKKSEKDLSLPNYISNAIGNALNNLTLGIGDAIARGLGAENFSDLLNKSPRAFRRLSPFSGIGAVPNNQSANPGQAPGLFGDNPAMTPNNNTPGATPNIPPRVRANPSNNNTGGGSSSNSGTPIGSPMTNTSIQPNSLAGVISRAEAGSRGYNAYNKEYVPGGRIVPADREIDFSQMTVEDIRKRQNLPMGHPDKLHAVGKYQIIGKTLEEAIQDNHVRLDEKFTPDVQNRLFADFLIGAKRPAVRNYIKGLHDDSDRAIDSLAKEFAALQQANGRPYYDHGGTVSAERTRAALEQARETYARLIKEGKSPREAYRQAVGVLGESTNNADINDIIPPSVRDTPVKYTTDGKNVSTRTIGELGITRFSELQTKGGRAFSGGHNDPDVTYLGGIMRREMSSFDRIIAQASHFHRNSRPNSAHNQGIKLDYTVKDGDYDKAMRETREILARRGMVEGKHYKLHPNPYHGTSPHIDIKVTEEGRNILRQERLRETAAMLKENEDAATKNAPKTNETKTETPKTENINTTPQAAPQAARPIANQSQEIGKPVEPNVGVRPQTKRFSMEFDSEESLLKALKEGEELEKKKAIADDIMMKMYSEAFGDPRKPRSEQAKIETPEPYKKEIESPPAESKIETPAGTATIPSAAGEKVENDDLGLKGMSTMDGF